MLTATFCIIPRMKLSNAAFKPWVTALNTRDHDASIFHPTETYTTLICMFTEQSLHSRPGELKYKSALVSKFL